MASSLDHPQGLSDPNLETIEATSLHRQIMILADPCRRSSENLEVKTLSTKNERLKSPSQPSSGCSTFRQSLKRHHFLGAGNIKVSFEFFPPKTPEMEQRLWASIRRLEPLEPTHIAITYGAGGSTRDRTHATLDRILTETMLKPAAHLTCVGATRSEVGVILQKYMDHGRSPYCGHPRRCFKRRKAAIRTDTRWLCQCRGSRTRNQVCCTFRDFGILPSREAS